MHRNSAPAAAGLALATLVCAVPLAASAQQIVFLPGAVVTQSAGASASGAGNGSVTTHSFGPWAHSFTSPAGVFGEGTGSASGSAKGVPAPLLSANLFASMNPATVPPGFETDFVNSAAYSATLIYSFEVLGPTSTALVNIHSLAQYASGGATTSTRFDALAQTSIDQMDANGEDLGRILTDRSTLDTFGNNVVATNDVTGSLATGFHGGFNENGIYNLQTYTRYQVVLQFSLALNIDGFGGSDTFTGSLDPTFSIAPGVANAGAYSFLFSDGIGNTPPTAAPEPSAWAMLLLGFGAVGAALRRGRQHQACDRSSIRPAKA